MTPGEPILSRRVDEVGYSKQEEEVWGAPPKPASVLSYSRVSRGALGEGNYPVCPEHREVLVTPHFLLRILVIPCNYTCLLPSRGQAWGFPLWLSSPTPVNS